MNTVNSKGDVVAGDEVPYEFKKPSRPVIKLYIDGKEISKEENEKLIAKGNKELLDFKVKLAKDAEKLAESRRKTAEELAEKTGMPLEKIKELFQV